MPNLHIRGVSEATIAAFKHRAEKTGKSLNETLRAALDEDAQAKRRHEAIEELTRIAKSMGKWDGPSIVEMIREDRDSR